MTLECTAPLLPKVPKLKVISLSPIAFVSNIHFQDTIQNTKNDRIIIYKFINN